MSKDQLTHIFENSACLTPRQMKGYISGKMVHEEAHAVEVHLLSCPFCADAIEGLMAGKDNGGLAAMDKLDAGFIAQHFGVPVQEVKAAVKTPPVIKAGAYSTQPEKKEKKGSTILWKPMAAAAAFIAVVAIMWFMRDSIFPQGDDNQLAQQTTVVPEPQEQVVAYQPPVDSTTALDSTAMAVTDEIAEDLAAPDPKAPLTQQQALLTKNEADKKALLLAEAKKTKALPKEAEKTVVASGTTATTAAPAATPRMGNSFAADDTKEEAEDRIETVAAAKKTADNARTGIEKADDLYNKGKYKRALKMYQDEMYDTRSNKRDAATYMAAKCHAGMGEKTQAKTLLNSLIRDNSPKKAQAEQLLRELGD